MLSKYRRSRIGPAPARSSTARPATAAPLPPRELSRPRLRLPPAALVMTLAVIAVAAVAGIPKGPMTVDLPAGAGPLLPFRSAARIARLTSLSPGHRVAVAVAALAFAGGSFIFALQAAWNGRLSLRLVIGLTLAFNVVAAAMPLLFSGDVYQYATYGRIAAVHHANPYVVAPVRFAADPAFRFVNPDWRGTTSFYGPAFVLISSTLARLVRGLAPTIVAFKALAAAASIATMAVAITVARRLSSVRAAFTGVLFGWNPVVLFSAVGGGHVDTLVALLLAIALILVLPQWRGSAGLLWPLASTAILALAAMIKAPMAVALVLGIVAAVARTVPGRRCRTLLIHLSVAVVTVGALAAPFIQTRNPTLGIASLSSVATFLAPPTFFRFLIASLVGDSSSAAARTLSLIIRSAFGAAFVATLLGLVRYLRSRSTSLAFEELGASWGWAMLVFTLAAPVLFPWYLLWILPVAWLLPRVPRVVVAAISAVIPLSQVVAVRARTPDLYETMLKLDVAVLAPALFFALILVIRELIARLRTEPGLASV
jgi:alpha-1,6-mannosyltransferase